MRKSTVKEVQAFPEGHAAKKWQDFGSELDHVMLWEGASGRRQPISSPLPLNCSPVTLVKALPLPGPQFPLLKMEALD